jgi:hypothetical protein
VARAGVAAALAVALLGGSRGAEAYCRTTTCTCSSAATCPTDCPKDTNGCVTTGQPLAWSGSCAGFALNIAGTSTLTADQWTSAILAGFDAWGAVDCGGGQPPSIDLLQLRDVSCSESQYNPSGPNVNVIYFDDNGWSGSTIDGSLASTTVFFSSSGEILDADVAVNSSTHDFSVSDQNIQTDLVSIITHEAGHFLGLAHSSNADAVMYYEYVPGTLRRALTADDIAAVCAVYPPSRQATCDPTPTGGLLSSCGSGGAGCSVAPRDDRQRAQWPLFVAAIGILAGHRTMRRWKTR